MTETREQASVSAFTFSANNKSGEGNTVWKVRTKGFSRLLMNERKSIS
ncbi:hypothetical protein [Sphingobacterium cellulitidis]